jgi:mevalonate kinase
MEKVTKGFLEFLMGEARSEFGSLIRENELLLEKLGVVSVRTKALIRKIERMGGTAKISGAGGSKENSGMVLIYHKDQEKLLSFAKKNSLDLFSVKIGEEGVKIEK